MRKSAWQPRRCVRLKRRRSRTSKQLTARHKWSAQSPVGPTCHTAHSHDWSTGGHVSCGCVAGLGTECSREAESCGQQRRRHSHHPQLVTGELSAWMEDRDAELLVTMDGLSRVVELSTMISAGLGPLAHRDPTRVAWAADRPGHKTRVRPVSDLGHSDCGRCRDHGDSDGESQLLRWWTHLV